jgi:hypothetical protein
MTYHGLLEYIRKAKDYGASDEEVIKRLRSAGWYQVDVQDGLDLYRKLTSENGGGSAYRPMPAPPTPSLLERVVPRHYDPHLIAVAAMSFALGFVGYFWLAQ